LRLLEVVLQVGCKDAHAPIARAMRRPQFGTSIALFTISGTERMAAHAAMPSGVSVNSTRH